MAPGRLSVTELAFQRCLGITAVGSSLYLAGLNNILHFSNVLPTGQSLENHDAVFVQNQIDRMIQRGRDISIAELLVERASRICGPPFHPHVFSRESGGQVAPHMIRGEVFREQAEPGLCDFAIGARIRVQQADQVSNLLRSLGNESAHAGRDG